MTFQSDWTKVRHERIHTKELLESSNSGCEKQQKGKERNQSPEFSSKIIPEDLKAVSPGLTEGQNGKGQLQPSDESSGKKIKKCEISAAVYE